MELKAEKKKVLFICTHNSARSQMAEGFLKAHYPDRYEAYSAGTEPSSVNPFAVRVMQEIGIDISHHRAKGVSEFLDREIDYVVTVCDHARQTCPFFPGGKEVIHRGFEDPAAFNGSEEEKLDLFRRVRDEIRGWIEETFGEVTASLDETA
jgi:arsenate reductase